jgi:hypothetical protein
MKEIHPFEMKISSVPGATAIPAIIGISAPRRVDCDAASIAALYTF